MPGSDQAPPPDFPELDEPEKALAISIYHMDGGGQEPPEDPPKKEKKREPDEMHEEVEADVLKRSADLSMAIRKYVEEKLTLYGIETD